MGKKVVKLTESDLVRIVKRVISEQSRYGVFGSDERAGMRQQQYEKLTKALRGKKLRIGVPNYKVDDSQKNADLLYDKIQGEVTDIKVTEKGSQDSYPRIIMKFEGEYIPKSDGKFMSKRVETSNDKTVMTEIYTDCGQRSKAIVGRIYPGAIKPREAGSPETHRYIVYPEFKEIVDQLWCKPNQKWDAEVRAKYKNSKG